MGISRHDKQALADLFIHMGVPLVQSIQTVNSWSGEEENSSETAKNLSKLLTVSVDLATKITKKMEIRDSYTLENVRGKVIRIVTPLIADHYVTGGNVPTESDIESMVDLFDVLISFAESVSPTDEKGSKPVKMASMIEACEPILSAIQENDLEQNPQALFNAIIAGIVTRSKDIATKLGIDNPIEDGLFKSIVVIFVSEYKKAKKSEDIDTVWKKDDEKLAIIQGLTTYVGEKADIKIDKPKKENAPVAETKKVETEKEDKKEPDDKKSDDDGEDDGDFNPMAFFGSGG
jgi:hypothetical protein